MASLYYRTFDAAFSVVAPLGDYARVKTASLLAFTQALYVMEASLIISGLLGATNPLLKLPDAYVAAIYFVIWLANIVATKNYIVSGTYKPSTLVWLFFISPLVLFVPSLLPLWLPYTLPCAALLITLLWLARRVLISKKFT